MLKKEIEHKYMKMVHKILILGHRITDQVTRKLKPHGISEPQFNVLRILKGQNGKPIAVQDIQCRMVQRSSNVTRILDKLIEKGLVKRSVCSDNRRRMDITITQAGETQLQALSEEVRQLHGPLLAQYNEDELEQLNQLLDRFQVG